MPRFSTGWLRNGCTILTILTAFSFRHFRYTFYGRSVIGFGDYPGGLRGLDC